MGVTKVRGGSGVAQKFIGSHVHGIRALRDVYVCVCCAHEQVCGVCLVFPGRVPRGCGQIEVCGWHETMTDDAHDTYPVARE